MSASQLLRILQTLPADADDEICSVFNTDELEASMNRSSRCTNPFLSNEDDNNVNFWNNPELETSIFANEFTNNHEDETFQRSTTTCNVPSHLFEKTTGFYIDKHSVECELPELMVCYKESDFHVKNICIDEGIPDEGNNSVNNHEFVSNSIPVNGDDDDMIEASLDTEFLNHEWLRSSTMACCYADVELNSSVQNATDNYGPDNSTNTCEEKLNLSINLEDDVFTDQPAPNSMLSLRQDWSLEFNESSNIFADDVNQLPLQGSKEELGKRAIVGSEAEKLSRNSQLKNILSESKMEGSVTFHFDTVKTAKSSDPCGAMNPESVYELPLDTESGPNHQDVSSRKVAVTNHEIRYVEGESSFSMANVISELISCSRPIPFSGGISNRSDSSATSTTSFAFPTLETEYISSPVRMGKAERRRLQKQSGWRKGLLCCKF